MSKYGIMNPASLMGMSLGALSALRTSHFIAAPSFALMPLLSSFSSSIRRRFSATGFFVGTRSLLTDSVASAVVTLGAV